MNYHIFDNKNNILTNKPLTDIEVIEKADRMWFEQQYSIKKAYKDNYKDITTLVDAVHYFKNKCGYYTNNRFNQTVFTVVESLENAKPNLLNEIDVLDLIDTDGEIGEIMFQSEKKLL